MFGKSKIKLLEEQLGVLQEELVQTKRQLKTTNTLFSSFLKQQNMNGYVLHVSSNGEILNATGAIFHVLGFTIDQIIGKRLSEITNQEDKKKVQECLCRELKYHGNIRRISSKHEIKTMESFAYVCKDDASILFNEWDISHNTSHDKINLLYLLNAFPHMAYIKDSNGTFCMVNEKFANCFGKNIEYFENKLKTGNTLVHQTLYANDVTIQNEDQAYCFEAEWPDGIMRNVKNECFPISSINQGKFYGYNQPLYLYVIQEVSTETKQTHGTCGAHFRCKYNVEEKEFSIPYTTQSFCEIIGKNDFVKNIHKDDIEMFYYSLDKISKSAHPWRWQGRLHIDDKIKRINIIAWPVVQNDSSDMLGMIQDLTNETYEKKINMLMMRHVSDVIALHSFVDGIKPEMKTFSHSMKEVLGYETIQNDEFWKLHPDDSVIIQEILYKMKRGIADSCVYRIKHKNEHWVKVKTEFIPFDNEFITISKKVSLF